MLLSEWFDPRSDAHLAAWRYFTENGSWPKDFIPPYVKIGPPFWVLEVIIKLSQAWVDYKLLES